MKHFRVHYTEGAPPDGGLAVMPPPPNKTEAHNSCGDCKHLRRDGTCSQRGTPQSRHDDGCFLFQPKEPKR